MKLISKLFATACFLVCTSFAFAKPHPANKLNVFETVDRHLSGFSSVFVGGSFNVYIIQGAVESVKVEAPADVIDRIKTEVNNGVLRIFNKNEEWNWGDWFGRHKKAAIYVTIKEVNSIDLSGSGDVFFKDGLAANSLKLKISGSGDITGKVDVKSLESSVSGSGDMKLFGRAVNSIVSVVGSGDFTGTDLVTVNTAVRVTGSGDAVINANNKIDAAVYGSGDVRYTGAASNITSSKAGSGDISRL